MQVNIDEACVCSSKEPEKGRTMTADKAQSVCVWKNICHLCLCVWAHTSLFGRVYVPVYEYVCMNTSVFIWRCFMLCMHMCEWNMLNMYSRSLPCEVDCSISNVLQSSPVLVVLHWPELRWGYSLTSSSSHLYASTVQHSQGPRLNLFFLIAHNCSVDVYFLISSDITGAW